MPFPNFNGTVNDVEARVSIPGSVGTRFLTVPIVAVAEAMEESGVVLLSCRVCCSTPSGYHQYSVLIKEIPLQGTTR